QRPLCLGMFPGWPHHGFAVFLHDLAPGIEDGTASSLTVAGSYMIVPFYPLLLWVDSIHKTREIKDGTKRDSHFDITINRPLCIIIWVERLGNSIPADITGEDQCQAARPPKKWTTIVTFRP
ncbi:hypothetical protein ATANTOWER_002966, partial [Ataeniobius toweri]|nr:hypothetical protein [Ataeniobius toweri]